MMMRAARNHAFAIGDLVFHNRMDADDPQPRDVGDVVGFAAAGPTGPWLTVKTNDGKWRIWHKDRYYGANATARSLRLTENASAA